MPDHRAGAQLTADEFLRLTPPETERWELLDGVVVVSPSPSLRHQLLAKRLFAHLLELERGGLGSAWWGIDSVLGARNVLEPDVLFVKAERSEILQPHAIMGPPDLVVEVLSPSTRRRDRVVKARIYARAGVPTLWIVDPDDDRVDVHRLRRRSYGKPTALRPPALLRHDDLPGLEVDLSALFARS